MLAMRPCSITSRKFGFYNNPLYKAYIFIYSTTYVLFLNAYRWYWHLWYTIEKEAP
jgi:hypothetical protein